MDLNTVTEVAQPGNRQDLPPWQPGDAWLAGGTWLFSEPQPDVTRLIDLVELGWPALETSPSGLSIGATCTFANLAAAELPPAWHAAPLLRQCCRALLGSFKVWNAATVGGNLCLALPAAPMAALATALNGVCRIWTPQGDHRSLPAIEFIRGPSENALRPGEVLRAVDIAADALQQRTAFRQTSLTPLGRSAALLIGTLDPAGSFTLTVTASTRRPVRLDYPAIPSGQELRRSLTEAIPDSMYYDDLHGAPDWRRHMTFRLSEDIRRDLQSA